MRRLATVVITLVSAAGCDSPKRATVGMPDPASAQESDSAFKAMDLRHGNMIGEDPMTLEHQFVAQSDGGDIILERQIHENMGINQIRSHLLLISRSFARGDFALPGFVHEKPVPGTSVMADRADKISYTVEDLPHGGVVHIRTSDAEALKAIHSFIEFQIAEHRTAH